MTEGIEFSTRCIVCGASLGNHGWEQARKCRDNLQILKLAKELNLHE